MRISKKAVAGISALALASGGVLMMSSADAAEPAPAGRDATTSIPNTKGAVTNWHLGKGTVYGDNLGPGMVQWFTTVYDGSVHMKGLDADLKGQLENGKGVGTGTFAPKVIAKIGGSFAANKTEVGTMQLPGKGIYLINTSAMFDRKNATDADYAVPTTETYPSLVLRYGTDDKDAGTIMGSPVSKAGFVELTGSSTKTVSVDGPTTINVYGFGYNEDRSAFGAGQITVSAQATAVKIG